MNDSKDGDDAGDRAPRPAGGNVGGGAETKKPAAPNDDRLKDDDQSVPVEDMNSANDE